MPYTPRRILNRIAQAAMLTVCFVIIAFGFSATRAHAATTTLSGNAWSDNAGWISFKGSSPAYGVALTSGAGSIWTFSGAAWSDGYGWLSFNSADVSFAGCGSGAQLDTSTGNVTGWAVFINGAGGTGCVSFSGTSPTYGVTYNIASKQFSGAAWSDTVGWISFSGSSPTYAVVTDTSLVNVPIVTITASPTRGTVNVVNPELTWSATNNPISCTATGDWGGSVGIKGDGVPQGALTQVRTYTYTLSCSNAGGAGPTSSATVDVSRINDCTPPVTETRHVACDMSVSSGDVIQSRTKDPDNSCNYGPWTYQSDTCVPQSGGNPPGNPGAGFDFTLGSANPSTVSVYQGQSAQTSVKETLATGTPSGVNISFNNIPNNVSGAASTCTPTCNSTLTLTADQSAGTGQSTVTFTATGGGASHSGSFTLNIVPSQDINAVCTPSSGTVAVGQPMQWSSRIISGGTEPYTYNWSGDGVPADSHTNAQFTTSYSTVGRKTVSVTVTDSTGKHGTCNPAGTVQVGFTPAFQEF